MECSPYPWYRNSASFVASPVVTGSTTTFTSGGKSKVGAGGAEAVGDAVGAPALGAPAGVPDVGATCFLSPPPPQAVSSRVAAASTRPTADRLVLGVFLSLVSRVD